MVGRVPKELWAKVDIIVQEPVTKTSPKKKKCKKAKWLSEEALNIAQEIREAKSKGEKEIYTHLNAELQRIARRDKKAFITDQCKEIEENNRMEKTMQQWPQDWKRLVFIPIPKKGNAKECSNSCIISLQEN